jgi:TPP-dependent pyruvate/acetoin dehydrogenase alpha subunit
MTEEVSLHKDDREAETAIFPEQEIALYKAMLRVRRAEESLAELYKEKEMRTPTHFGIGQEAVAVGICEALQTTDITYSHHRCHAHYLAKGGSLLGLVAELYGRVDGCSRGRGGSVHLTASGAGFAGSSPILGQGVALAVGSALAFKMDGVPRIAVTFFGEATCEEGVFYESLNYAAVHKLPVLFSCENNLYSTESPLSIRQPAGTELGERVRAFKVPAKKVDGNDVTVVHEAAREAVAYIRSGKGPYFLECMTYRWREHVGPMFDHELNRAYRTREEVEQWMAKCPVKRCGERLIHMGLAAQADLAKWLDDIDSEIRTVVAQAKASPWPEPSALFENVY